MIITISGAPGAGDTTTADMLSKKLGYEVIKVGEIYKKLAKEKNLDPDQLWEKHEKTPEKLKEFHRKLDEKQKEKVEKKKNVIVNGKLSAHHLPNAKLKILLTANLEERAKRIAMRKKIGREKYAKKVDKGEKERETKELTRKEIEKQIKKIKKRQEKEKKHWKDIYGFNYLEDREKYDLIVDTTNKKPSEAVEKIKKEIEKIKDE